MVNLGQIAWLFPSQDLVLFQLFDGGGGNVRGTVLLSSSQNTGINTLPVTTAKHSTVRTAKGK